VIRFAPGLADRLARLALAVASIATVTSCGSGAVSGPVPVVDPARITILPATATAFSGLPTTFVVSGGTGSYIVSSSNQAVIQVAGALAGSTFTIVPNPVLADTPVTLTVRDTGTAPVATAAVTVRPGTVSNNITITPTGSQASACTPALCSGGDALVSATLSQGGIPLPARGVRFEVITGDFRFVTTDSLTGIETLSSSVNVFTDETGKAQARIRATANAANQTALLQITDIGTGAFQRTSFVIAQSTGTSPGFFTTPASVAFQGAFLNQCASGVAATVFVFGGVPPYTVSNTISGFFVTPNFISSSGGSYTVTATSTCVPAPGLPIIVSDSSGHTATTTVTNIPGTQAVTPVTVAPSTVTLTSCTGSANVTVAGGTGGPYFASFGSDALQAVGFISGNTLTIQRNPTSPATPGPLSVGISDGRSVATVTVNLVGGGAGACPSLVASPSSVTLSSCAPVTVTISGGSGTYATASSDSSVTATTPANPTFTIGRTTVPPTASFTGPATVTVTDTNNPNRTVSIPVTGTGTGPGSGTGACP
jgi:hypothetical protein